MILNAISIVQDETPLAGAERLGRCAIPRLPSIAAWTFSTSAHAVGPPANEKTSGPCRAIEIVEVMRLTTSSARLESNYRERDSVLVGSLEMTIKNE